MIVQWQLNSAGSIIPDSARHGAVSIGNFDGVHLGHAELVKHLVANAHEVSGPATVVTFDPHPAALLRPEAAPPRLTTLERRAQLLHRQGVHSVVVCRVTDELLKLSAEAFFDAMVRDGLSARAMVEGPNFFFGRNREGDTETLSQLCQRDGIRLQIVQPTVAGDQEMISSTRIRQLIEAGDVALANRWLVAPYQLSGRVVVGDRRGRTLGFPTANLEEIGTVVPGPGVYASRVWVGKDAYVAATHVGPNLTFEPEGRRKVETHLLDFSDDLYDQTVLVDFHEKVRDIARFDSAESLIEQMQRDVAATRRLLDYP